MSNITRRGHRPLILWGAVLLSIVPNPPAFGGIGGVLGQVIGGANDGSIDPTNSNNKLGFHIDTTTFLPPQRPDSPYTFDDPVPPPAYRVDLSGNVWVMSSNGSWVRTNRRAQLRRYNNGRAYWFYNGKTYPAAPNLSSPAYQNQAAAAAAQQREQAEKVAAMQKLNAINQTLANTSPQQLDAFVQRFPLPEQLADRNQLLVMMQACRADGLAINGFLNLYNALNPGHLHREGQLPRPSRFPQPGPGPGFPQPGPSFPQSGPSGFSAQSGLSPARSAYPQPGPGYPQPGPGNTQPGPGDSQPGPVGPQPGSGDIQPCPGGIQPDPSNSQPTPFGPQSVPGDSQPSPVDPQSAPVGPQSAPVDPQSAPVDSQPSPVDPQSLPSGPLPSPVGGTTDRGRPRTPAAPRETYAVNLGIYYVQVPCPDGTFGARITRAPDPRSPAGQIGVEVGDIIFELDGQRLNRPEDVLAHKDQTTVDLINVRNNQVVQVSIFIP